MAFNGIEQLPGEPIFIFTFDGLVTISDVNSAFAVSAETWCDAMRLTGMHNILVLTNITSDFSTVMKALRIQAEQNSTNYEIRQHIQQYMVSTDPMAHLFASARALEQFGSQPVPDFAHLEDAIAAARTAIKTRVSVDWN